jgi:hypothetical protein
MVDLLKSVFEPQTATAILIALGVFSAFYTAGIKFFFDKRIKRFELDMKSTHDKELQEIRIDNSNFELAIKSAYDKGLEQIRNDNSIELKGLEAQLAARNQVLAQHLQAEHDEALKKLDAQLTRTTQAEQAQRDYEYEARKHLYRECKPLIFQFVELAEDALYQIYSLARSARRGDLPAWLQGNNKYYIASTMYRLLAPLAIYKLIRRRITIVDLTLDYEIDVHYQLAKLLAWSFTADFDLAGNLGGHHLDYDPNVIDWQELRQQNPQTYWRQGLAVGRFDNAVEAMIMINQKSDPTEHRLISFGEFESALHASDSAVANALEIVSDIFLGFDPEHRPVLWRVLVTQAHIYDAIVRFHRANGGQKELVVRPIPESDRAALYWRRNPSDIERRELDAPFDVAEAYLQKWLKRPLFQAPVRLSAEDMLHREINH